MSPADTCLQCGESRAAVKRHRHVCAIVGGHEDTEVKYEFDRHRWRDWTDVEFHWLQIDPSLWEKHRRTPWRDLELVMAESQCIREGHLAPDPEYGTPDHCPRCWVNLTELRASGMPVHMKEATTEGTT